MPAPMITTRAAKAEAASIPRASWLVHVDLDDRDLDAADAVAECEAGVREPARIHRHGVDAYALSVVDAVDRLASTLV